MKIKALFVLVISPFVLTACSLSSLTSNKPIATEDVVNMPDQAESSLINPEDQTPEVIVKVTDTGYVPNSITVKVGQTVIWQNETNSAVWIASNPHPAHSDYPEFDEKGSMSKGESFSFTFTKAGTWGYHDHFKPSAKGFVTVE